MRDSRNRRKVKDITERKIDTEGKVIKNHLDELNMLNRIIGEDQNFSHAMSSSTNNLRPLAQKQKQIGDTNMEKEANIQSCIQKNWFHSYIWPAIDQAVGKSKFSLQETVTYLQSCYKNTHTCDKLSPSTIHNRINSTKSKQK